MKVNVTGPQKEGVLLHYACLDVFLVPPEKKVMGKLLLLLGKGEFPPESHSIPFSPYFHVLCVCLYGCHASRVIVKMNQEPLLLLSYPPVSP